MSRYNQPGRPGICLIPLYNQQRMVEHAAARLSRHHGSPGAALDALRPALTRLRAASVASARARGCWALLERASRRYGFWIAVRIELLRLQRQDEAAGMAWWNELPALAREL
jgi:hypothetical protein